MQPVTAGYSRRSLRDKLGIKAGATVFFAGMPGDVEAAIGDLGDVERTSDAGRATYLHFFIKTEAELDAIALTAAQMEPQGQLVWVSWPKKSSRVPSEVSEQDLRDALLPTGLVDVKIAAISDVWSGLLFRWRRVARNRHDDVTLA